jgi:hypothetical protein
MKYRDDGWPICPDCGEDELMSFAMMEYACRLALCSAHEPKRPSIEQCLREPFKCNMCGSIIDNVLNIPT